MCRSGFLEKDDLLVRFFHKNVDEYVVTEKLRKYVRPEGGGLLIVVPCGVATTIMFCAIFRMVSCGGLWCLNHFHHNDNSWWQVVYARHAPYFRVFFRSI